MSDLVTDQWVDGYGRTWYQPVANDGRALWWEKWYATMDAGREKVWRREPTNDGPVVYRSQRRAERKAQRRDNRVLKARKRVLTKEPE